MASQIFRIFTVPTAIGDIGAVFGEGALRFFRKRVIGKRIYILRRDVRHFLPSFVRAYQHQAPNQWANGTQPPHAQNDQKRAPQRNTANAKGGQATFVRETVAHASRRITNQPQYQRKLPRAREVARAKSDPNDPTATNPTPRAPGGCSLWPQGFAVPARAGRQFPTKAPKTPARLISWGASGARQAFLCCYGI